MEDNSKTVKKNSIGKTVENQPEENVEKITVEKTCECAKPIQQENFECKNCMTNLCKNCPSGPIKNQCILCIFGETPHKNTLFA